MTDDKVRENPTSEASTPGDGERCKWCGGPPSDGIHHSHVHAVDGICNETSHEVCPANCHAFQLPEPEPQRCGVCGGVERAPWHDYGVTHEFMQYHAFQTPAPEAQRCLHPLVYRRDNAGNRTEAGIWCDKCGVDVTESPAPEPTGRRIALHSDRPGAQLHEILDCEHKGYDAVEYVMAADFDALKADYAMFVHNSNDRDRVNAEIILEAEAALEKQRLYYEEAGIEAKREHEERLAALRRIEAALAEARKPTMCGVCAGTGKPISGRPCICGGVGTEQGEMDGLRRELERLRAVVGGREGYARPR